MNHDPIGVFDSGVGGLNVLSDLISTFPHENLIYLADTARIPYGNKSSATIEKYVRSNIGFLRSKSCKAIVVACNSASSVLKPDQEDFPVLGVIEPGSKEAAIVTQNKKVGVIGTRATVSMKSYVTSIQSFDPEVMVYQQAAPLLVPLVEEGWDKDPITNLVIYRYLSPLLSAGVDTIVLGCTHFPFLLEGIIRVTGKGIQIINSGPPVAKALRHILQTEKLETKLESMGQLEIYATDISDIYQKMADRILRNIKAPPIRQIDI